MRANAVLLLAGVALVASACSTARQAPVPGRPAASALDRMERLTLAANRCWFKSGDPAFARYSIAPELSSFSGRPRFLLVPKNRPEARPLLVVEGRNGSSAVSTYGPVMDGALGARVDADIRRWNAGGTACAA